MASRIDTLATHRTFRQAGIEPAHAEAIVEAINRADERLATKDDLALLRSDPTGEFAEFRTELRGEVATVRSELRGEIESVRTDLSGKIESVETRLGASIGLEVGSARTNLRGEIASFRTEAQERFAGLEGEVAAIRSQLGVMKWTMRMNVAAMVAVFVRLFGLS